MGTSKRCNDHQVTLRTAKTQPQPDNATPTQTARRARHPLLGALRLDSRAHRLPARHRAVCRLGAPAADDGGARSRARAVSRWWGGKLLMPLSSPPHQTTTTPPPTPTPTPTPTSTPTPTPTTPTTIQSNNINQQPTQGVELLPYHLYGRNKWRALGLDYPLEGVAPPPPGDVARVVGRLRDAGLRVLCEGAGGARDLSAAHTGAHS